MDGVGRQLPLERRVWFGSHIRHPVEVGIEQLGGVRRHLLDIRVYFG